MNIQYCGFVAGATARIYAFRVIDTIEATREFTVRVRLAAFSPPALRFQDGPEISFTRLKRELGGETRESPANPHLRIEEPDIREYLLEHHPRKRGAPGKNFGHPMGEPRSGSVETFSSWRKKIDRPLG